MLFFRHIYSIYPRFITIASITHRDNRQVGINHVDDMLQIIYVCIIPFKVKIHSLRKSSINKAGERFIKREDSIILLIS